MAFSAKTEMNSAPISFRLRSGSVTPLSCARKRSEASTPRTRSPRRSRSISRVSSNFFLTHKAVFHESVDERVAVGAMPEAGGCGETHTAAKRANDASLPCLLANGLGGFFDEGRAAPLGFGSADAK